MHYRRSTLLIWLLALCGQAEAQQPGPGPFIQVSPTPSKLSVGGPGFVQIDAQGVASIAASAPGSGTVTNTGGALSLNHMVVGNGGADIKTISGTLGGAFTTGGDITFTGAASGATLAFPSGGPFTFTFPPASQTLASLAGSETFTNKIYSSGQLSGTFNGNPTFSGIPLFTNLLSGTQTVCLGLDSGFHLVTSAGACGSGSSGISGLTAGQVPLAGSATTLTSSFPLGTGTQTALGVNVGTAGAFVVNGGALGTPSSGTGTNITGLPISSGVSGLGTGVATALGVNVGTAGAFAKNNGDALSGTYTGTPTFSGNLTFSGVPKYTGLSTGTIASGKNLGLDSSNNLVVNTVSGGGTGCTVAGGSGDVQKNDGAGACAAAKINDSGALTVINYNTGALPAPPGTGTVLQLGAADTNSTRILLDTFGASSTITPTFAGRSARGTNASKTAVQSGDVLVQFSGLGYGATGYSSSNRGAFSLTAAENWSDTAQGSKFTLSTTPNTTAAPAIHLIVDNDGGVIIAADASGAPPTGGSKGAGTINTTGSYYINNVALPTVGGTNTWTGTQTFGSIIGTVVARSGTTDTLAAGDCGKTIEYTSASAVTVTAPNSLVIGCHIAIVQGGAGQVTISAGASATLVSAHSYTKTFGQSAGIGLSVIENSGGSAAKYFLFGDGA